MNRRTFFKALAAAPAISVLGPAGAVADLPKAKITRVRIYRPPNLNPLFNQSNMVVTVETDIGITGIGEGRRQGHARAVRRDADRQEPVPDRGDLAGGLHRLVLSAGPREGPRARRARPGAVGHQGQGARGCRCTSCSAAAARDYCECYATGGAASARHAARRDAQPEGARAGDDRGRAIARSGWRRPKSADRRRLRHALGRPAGRAGLQGRPRSASGPTATGASTSTSGST